MHTCTPHLFDQDITVHNDLHNTRTIMHTQCHAWFHDIVRIWLGPFVCSKQIQTIIWESSDQTWLNLDWISCLSRIVMSSNTPLPTAQGVTTCIRTSSGFLYSPLGPILWVFGVFVPISLGPETVWLFLSGWLHTLLVCHLQYKGLWNHEYAWSNE